MKQLLSRGNYNFVMDLDVLGHLPQRYTSGACYPFARDAGTGGGQWGQLAPTTLKLWGRRPPTLDCESRSFLFLFVFARELGSLLKIVGQFREVFSFE